MMLAYCTAIALVLGLSDALPDIPQEEWVLNFDSPVYVCSDAASQEFVDTSGVEVQRHNETFAYMTGTFKFLKGIEPCTVVELIVERDKNGRVEPMMTHDICDLCAEIGAESGYYKYLKHFGIPDTCPFSAVSFIK
ncbi:uncharacterized protein LOC135083614 [Ostrinia nubilalis]|uniref:uncharacterized protein LOC135083614 n=1 Tax=Ostrinia nubilalis TaxID=29057 RepID=UPI0030824084